MAVNNNLERVWKEDVVTYIKAPSRKDWDKYEIRQSRCQFQGWDL